MGMRLNTKWICAFMCESIHLGAQRVKCELRLSVSVCQCTFSSANVDGDTLYVLFIAGYAGVMMGIRCIRSFGFVRGSQTYTTQKQIHK